MERIVGLTKQERQKKLKPLEMKDEQLHIYGFA
jgi:hypothetical protein